MELERGFPGGHLLRINCNKNLYGRDGRMICGPQCVPKSTSVTLAVDEKTLPMATITGRTDRQSATQYAA